MSIRKDICKKGEDLQTMLQVSGLICWLTFKFPANHIFVILPKYNTHFILWLIQEIYSTMKKGLSDTMVTKFRLVTVQYMKSKKD